MNLMCFNAAPQARSWAVYCRKQAVIVTAPPHRITCSMKGDVKRHFSPADWKAKGSLDIQPRVPSAEILSASLVPVLFMDASLASFRS
jgi:hypothetical protein